MTTTSQDMEALFLLIKQRAQKHYASNTQGSLQFYLEQEAQHFGFECWEHALACLADAKRGEWKVTEWQPKEQNHD